MKSFLSPKGNVNLASKRLILKSYTMLACSSREISEKKYILVCQSCQIHFKSSLESSYDFLQDELRKYTSFKDTNNVAVKLSYIKLLQLCLLNYQGHLPKFPLLNYPEMCIFPFFHPPSSHHFP